MKGKVNEIFEKLACGKLVPNFYIVMDDDNKITPEYEISVQSKNKTAVLFAKNEVFRDCIYLNFDDEKIIARRVFENVSNTDIRVKDLVCSISGIDFKSKADDDYFYHVENARVFGNMTFPIDYNRYDVDAVENAKFGIVPGDRWDDMGKIDEPLPERIGGGLFQAFPAILISNYNVKKGLVHGTLSQKVFYHSYDAKHENGAVTLDIFSSFMDIDALTMEPGRVLIDEWYLGTTDEADNIEKLFEGYTKVLRKKLPTMYGKGNANRKSVTWGSWNDGLWRWISEDVLLTEARFLKENFPTVEWFQVDDGYAINNMCHSIGMPYSGEEELDSEKFPNGFRYYTDELRKIGIRPAVWMGCKCPHASKIYKEHPEWFLNYNHILPDSNPLDVSREDVREYMKKAIHKLIKVYGFDSIKLDFWSHPFEDCHALLSDTKRSGYEWRSWWLSEIRNMLPQDGYLQTGCDIAMGNPFLGEYATNYRYGIDISHGNWVNVKLTLLWGINCFATHTGDMFVPNSDSIGLFPGLSEAEAMFCINFCLVTHSMVEIAGQLSKSTDEKRIKTLKKAICNPNNGQDVYFVNYDYRAKKTKPMPDAMYFKTPHFSCEEGNPAMPVVTVGLFNTDDIKKTVCVSCADLGLKEDEYIFTNVWNGEQFKQVNKISIELEPHSSALYAVNKTCGIQLFDANIRINALKANENEVIIETDYAIKEAELRFNKKITKIFFDDTEIPFESIEDTAVFDLPGKGILRIMF